MYKIRISPGQNFCVALASHLTHHPFYSDNHPPELHTPSSNVTIMQWPTPDVGKILMAHQRPRKRVSI